MELLLVRHGIAEDVSSTGRDRDRALTPTGIERFSECVAGVGTLGWAVDLVLHSPWRRAVETGRLMAPIAGGERARIEAFEPLAEPPDQRLLSEVMRYEEHRVALVGHEPWMSTLCAWLAFDRPELGYHVAFKKGGIARLEGSLAPGGMQLLSFVAPAVTRRIATV